MSSERGIIHPLDILYTIKNNHLELELGDWAEQIGYITTIYNGHAKLSYDEYCEMIVSKSKRTEPAPQKF